MKFDVARLIVPIAAAGIAALGGAAIVFSEFDDAPGGMLIGLLLIAGAAVLGVRNASR
ncbi:MAG TPA: hypothetical protein VLA33_05570 [Gemmatimonadota bacterium]|nr:hypothetical protein [Gemmatimonadota bacterium]